MIKILWFYNPVTGAEAWPGLFDDDMKEFLGTEGFVVQTVNESIPRQRGAGLTFVKQLVSASNARGRYTLVVPCGDFEASLALEMREEELPFFLAIPKDRSIPYSENNHDRFEGYP